MREADVAGLSLKALQPPYTLPRRLSFFCLMVFRLTRAAGLHVRARAFRVRTSAS